MYKLYWRRCRFVYLLSEEIDLILLYWYVKMVSRRRIRMMWRTRSRPNQLILISEAAILNRIDQTVFSFSTVLQDDVDESQAKCRVTPADVDNSDNSLCKTGHLLKTNCNLEDVKLSIFEFLSIDASTTEKTLRDVSRFFGYFEFNDIADNKLWRRMIPINQDKFYQKNISSSLIPDKRSLRIWSRG